MELPTTLRSRFARLHKKVAVKCLKSHHSRGNTSSSTENFNCSVSIENLSTVCFLLRKLGKKTLEFLMKHSVVTYKLKIANFTLRWLIPSVLRKLVY